MIDRDGGLMDLPKHNARSQGLDVAARMARCEYLSEIFAIAEEQNSMRTGRLLELLDKVAQRIRNDSVRVRDVVDSL